jgi:hypothetical protein
MFLMFHPTTRKSKGENFLAPQCRSRVRGGVPPAAREKFPQPPLRISRRSTHRLFVALRLTA